MLYLANDQICLDEINAKIRFAFPFIKFDTINQYTDYDGDYYLRIIYDHDHSLYDYKKDIIRNHIIDRYVNLDLPSYEQGAYIAQLLFKLTDSRLVI